jgi:hypothetical protein
MTLPNFLVIGAGRAGTTSLYHWLRQHPNVFMSPIKETNFFAYRALGAGQASPETARSASFPVRSLEQYQGLFRDASRQKAIGEASPRYMAVPRAAWEIADVLPQARLIAVLRDPIERAYSSYLFHRRDGRERRSFERAVREEREGTPREGLRFGQRHYLALGCYDRMLGPYFERFPPDRIRVFLFDDLARDPGALLGDLFRFLDVDPSFRPDVSVRYNASGVFRSGLARAAFRKRPWLVRAKRRLPGPLRHGLDRGVEALRSRRLEVPPLAEETRRELASLYADDVARLADRIGRDLGAWLAPQGRTA